MQPRNETVDTIDQTSSVLLLGLAILGSAVVVGTYLLIGG